MIKKNADIIKMSTAEMWKEIAKTKLELAKTNIKIAIRQETNTAKAQEMKKYIAKLRTFITQKEYENA